MRHFINVLLVIFAVLNFIVIAMPMTASTTSAPLIVNLSALCGLCFMLGLTFGGRQQ